MPQHPSTHLPLIGWGLTSVCIQIWRENDVTARPFEVRDWLSISWRWWREHGNQENGGSTIFVEAVQNPIN